MIDFIRSAEELALYTLIHRAGNMPILRIHRNNNLMI